MATKYKFLYEKDGQITSAHGNTTWAINEWQEITKQPLLCVQGFHCSPTVLDAFSYIAGDVLAEVEVAGDSDVSSDKSCHQRMRLTAAYRWKKEDSVALAAYTARLVLHIFEEAYPDDDRPRKAIEAAESGDATAAVCAAVDAAALAADADRVFAAAYAADAAYAARAARAAAYAAYDAARAAAYAAYAADDAARAAAYAAYAADDAYAADVATKAKVKRWIRSRISQLERLG